MMLYTPFYTSIVILDITHFYVYSSFLLDVNQSRKVSIDLLSFV